jgi:two-component system response regulator DesR
VSIVAARSGQPTDVAGADRGDNHGMSSPSAPAPPIGLLVVDDDARVRAAIRQMIAGETDLLIVAEAADTPTASALARRTNPSIALVDVLVPDEASGLSLVGELSRRGGCAVVAMSVRGSLRRAALAAGAVAFVEKDGDVENILSVLRAAAV